MAGTSKSTIARTIANEFRSASFFLRDEKDRADSSKVISTLAVQLIKFSPDIKHNIREVVDKYFDIADQRKDSSGDNSFIRRCRFLKAGKVILLLSLLLSMP
jgi:hypothetical protein